MRWNGFGKVAVLGCIGVAAACSANSNESNYGGSGGVSGQGGAAAGGGAGGGPLYEGGPAGTGSTPSQPAGCDAALDEDRDKDGYTILEGDCNDCDANANPGAFDVTGGVDGGPGVDEDCNGHVDDEPAECDVGLAIDTADPYDGAKAIGLCRRADPNATGNARTWGVLSAKWVLADGTDGMNAMSHGVLPAFGASKPQQGASVLALSSGTARAPGMDGWKSPSGAMMSTECNPPIPSIETPACPGVVTGSPHDAAALEVQVRVPTNAKSFRFNLNFHTFEFPLYICSQFNDFYVTVMDPKPAGSGDGNISFDQDGNPISVNNSMLRVCKAQKAPPPGYDVHGQKDFACLLGTDLLAGTGYDVADATYEGPHAATGWLETSSPVQPGSVVTLRFAVWDSGDDILDSTVVLDNFTWSVEPASAAQTAPVDTPK